MEKKTLQQAHAELVELKDKADAALKNFKTQADTVAVTVSVTPEMLGNAMSSLYSSLDYVNQRVDRVFNALWQFRDEHTNGHLPSVKGAEQMQRAVDALGLDKEYDVQKRTVYASLNESGKVVYTV
jgi:hypothetical protein